MKRKVKMMEFYTDGVHKAKKAHKCDLCGHEIVVGVVNG
jgi:hypothetical protein